LNISDKVALYAVVPGAIISVLGIVSVILVSPIEARVNIIASTLTADTLLFLVSERLRESASRKLDYWNKKVLTAVMRDNEGLSPLWSAPYRAEAIGRNRDLLKRYARYGRLVKLYPKNLLLTMSMVQRYLLEYEKVYQKVLQEGMRRLGMSMFDLGVLLVAIGLQERGNYDITRVENHKNVLKWAETTEPGITDQFRKRAT
jgi:hypothetical protein